MTRKRRQQEPPGVTPYALWHRSNPDPSLGALAARYAAVAEAARRYRLAGLEPRPEWLAELLGFSVEARRR
jgi:hypothetical protein